jgi:hypothetical protein
MAKVTQHYFFLNRVAQMQRVAMRDAIAGSDARRLVQRKQQIVGHVRPKFSHDDRAILRTVCLGEWLVEKLAFVRANSFGCDVGNRLWRKRAGL